MSQRSCTYYLNFPKIDLDEEYKPNINPYTLKKKNEMTFVERNYNPEQIKNKNKKELRLISKQEVNSIFFKLKNIYNDIHIANIKNKEELNKLKSTNNKLIKKIDDIEKTKDINTEGKEKISVLNADRSTDEIINKIKKLQEEDSEAKMILKSEEEYKTTIKHMIESQKTRLHKIQEETLEIEKNIKDLEREQKIIIHNINTKEKSHQETMNLKNFIEYEIDKYKELFNEQNSKRVKMSMTTERKEEEIDRLRKELKEEKIYHKNEIRKEKKKILDMIKEKKEKEKEKKRKEKEYFDFIVGLHFFQKNFIEIDKNNQEPDIAKIKESDEYKAYFQPKEKKNKKNNIKTNNEQKPKKEINIEDLKRKFNELNLTYDIVYPYYIKLKGIEKSTREKMNVLNEKQVNLESRKELCKAKVKEIINKDYYNFESIVALNSKFKAFLEAHEPEIIKSKTQLVNRKITQITTTLNENEYHPEFKDYKKNINLFIKECTKQKNDYNVYIESILISMKECNNFKDYNTMKEKENKNIKTGPLIAKEIKSCTIDSFIKYHQKTSEMYLKDLLTFAIKKNINYANFIYNTLFLSKYAENNIEQFLNKGFLIDNYLFYFFTDLDQRKLMIEDFEKINDVYNEYIKHKVPKKHLFLNDVGEQEKKYSKNKNVNNNFPSPIKIGKPLFKKVYPVKKYTSTTINTLNTGSLNPDEPSEKRINTLENEIKREYHYEFSESSDDESNRKKKKNRRGMSIGNKNDRSKTLYESTLDKSKYLRTIHASALGIKQDTTKIKFKDHSLRKTWRDLDIIQNRFMVYSNPNINVDSLSNKTYRFIAEQMISISRGDIKAKNARGFCLKSNAF